MSTRLASALFVLVSLLIGTLAVFAPAMLASRELHQFCEALPLGAPLDEVRAQAASHEYGFDTQTDGSIDVQHPRSLGRVECSLRFDDGGMLASKSRL
jgi:hypothetical protein